MNTDPRKTLSLPVRPTKTVYKPAVNSASPPSYRMDEWAVDNQRMGNPRAERPRNDRPRYPKKAADTFRSDSPRDERGNRYPGSRQQEETSPNKIRRGPGRRLAKEKRIRSMDPALMQKYGVLSAALQEKVNAAIEIYYQQQMAKAYKGQVDESEADQNDDYIEEDVVYDADEPLAS